MITSKIEWVSSACLPAQRRAASDEGEPSSPTTILPVSTTCSVVTVHLLLVFSVMSIVGDGGACGSSQQLGSVIESTDSRHAMGTPYKATGRCNLWTHGPRGEVKIVKLA